MRCDWFIVGVLFRTELRMFLRDPRVLVTGLLLPALAMPLLIFGSSWGMKKRERHLKEITCTYAVAGSQAEWARALITAGLESQRVGRGWNASLPEIWKAFKAREVTVTNGLEALQRGDIHVLLTALSPEEAEKQPTDAVKPGKLRAGEALVAGTPVLRLTWRADREESTSAMNRLDRFLDGVREQKREKLLAGEGLLPPEKALLIEKHDLAPPARAAGVNIGRGLTLVLLLFVLTGGAIVALDTLAGEKERGSLETLLVSGAGRREIVAAKLLAVCAVGMAVAVAQVSSALLFASVRFIVLPIDISAALRPGLLTGLIVVYLPLIAFISAILLLLSARARTYKEAQLKFIPIMFVCLVPSVAPLLPSLSLHSIVAFIPIANTALSVKEVMGGHFDWLFLGASWISTAGAALWTVRLALSAVSEERFIAPATEGISGEPGPALFSRHVLIWFAVIWALVLVISNYLQKADVRMQLLANLLVFLLGGSLVMIWRYKLPVHETLSLRLPPAAAWLAVLCGVPGGLLTATGIFRLISYVAPVPRELIEAFSEEILPKNIGLIELFLYLSVLPGIVEEIAFRGVLLSGLRRRMRPVSLVLTVGAVFGLYHMALFRFGPTFALGVCLAITVLLTRSIYPAMLWHALNNGLGIWTAQNHILLGELEPPYYLIGVVALAVAFWILWRNRVRQKQQDFAAGAS